MEKLARIEKRHAIDQARARVPGARGAYEIHCFELPLAPGASAAHHFDASKGDSCQNVGYSIGFAKM